MNTVPVEATWNPARNAILYRQGTRTEFLMREHVRQAFDEMRPKSELLTPQSPRVSGDR
jgi:hypothetical protein